ncbi:MULTISPECIES: hypothetical protein [unclassified Schlesneria]|uniref:hypothetical protein n=1 Tax=unclassified Schlesneria TaxID=2762017 RepID=UPI002EEBD90B
MASDDENMGSEKAPSERRFWKRWILLVAMGGLLLWFGMWPSSEAIIGKVDLPDGKAFRIHKLTVGTLHSYNSTAASGLTSLEVRLNGWLARIGREILPVNQRGVTVHSQSTTVCVWHEFDWAADDSDATPAWAILSDQYGWRTSANLSGFEYLRNQAETASVSSHPRVEPYRFAMEAPVTGPQVKLELLNSTGRTLGSTSLAYSVPAEFYEPRTTRVLPAVAEDVDLTVTLVGLKADWSGDESDLWFGDSLTVTPEIVVKVNGVESRDWTYVTTKLSALESGYARGQLVASVESVLGGVAPLDSCTISPYQTAWKLHLPLVCRNPEKDNSAYVQVFSDISIEGGIAAIAESTAPPPAGSPSLKLLGAGRDGSFVYAAESEAITAYPNTVPLSLLTRNRLDGTIQSTFVPRAPGTVSAWSSLNPVTVNLNLTTQCPHLVMSVTDMGVRSPCVMIKSRNGQELEGDLYHIQGLLIWVAKLPYPEIDRIDATVVLQDARYFTFEVAPPAVPPRPQRQGRQFE